MPDATDVADAVTGAVALLRRLNWSRGKDLPPPANGKGRAKPVMFSGHRRALVGPAWTTFYAVRDDKMTGERSVPTADRDALTAEATK